MTKGDKPSKCRHNSVETDRGWYRCSDKKCRKLLYPEMTVRPKTYYDKNYSNTPIYEITRR